jgi:hypothetical protein
MEIKKFEAYRYRGKGLNSNRIEFIQEFIDIFTDEQILGLDVTGSEFHINDEILYLECSDKNSESYTIKLDLSDMGIEIGTREWNDDKEEFDEFILEVNLDTDTTKQIKSYKKSIKNYNI